MRRSRNGGKSGAPPAPYSWKIQTISFEVTENSQIGMENKNFPQTPPLNPHPWKHFSFLDLRMTYIWMRSTSSKVMHYDIIPTIHYQWVSKLHNVRLPTKYSLTCPNFSATIVSTALSVRTQNRGGGGFLLIKKRGMMSVRSLKRYKIWQAHSSIVTLPFSFRNFQ